MFSEFGYYKEYYLNKKFIGTLICDKDREVMGYCGKATETVTERLVLQNKKVLKVNSIVETQLFPLCGKIKNNLNI